MQKFMLLCLLHLFCAQVFAQNSGRGFSYQAVARTADGAVKAKENIEIQFSLLPGDVNAAPAWQEKHVATTDEFGVFALTIGKGLKSGGTAATFKEVSFAASDIWLRVELFDNGAWHEISNTQLLSVPFAEVAGNAIPAPTGSIMAFAGPKDKVPAGWHLCDGTQLSRSEYVDLYGVIGTAWGHGDGATTFHLPDLRGLFLRGVSYTEPKGWDPNKSNRPALYPGGNTNNAVGSYQDEEFMSHNHGGSTTNSGAHEHASIYRSTGGGAVGWENSNLISEDDGWSSNVLDAADNHPSGPSGVIKVSSSGSNHLHGINASGGSETRPDNAYVNYIIKL